MTTEVEKVIHSKTMTGGYIMKEKNIQELAKRMGLVTVEDMCQYTIAQLVVKIANKVNELVNEVWRFETDVQEILKTQNENIQYLLGEGLHLEVENIFDGWVNDGTFDTLINQSALKKVNERIDETNAQLSTSFYYCQPGTGDLTIDTKNVQNAINNCPSYTTIYLSGTYYLDKLSFKSDRKIVGNNCTIYLKDTLDLSGCAYVEIENVIFSCKEEDNDDAKPLVLIYMSNYFRFVRCRFELSFVNNRTLIVGQRTYYGKFDHCTFVNGRERDENNCLVYDGMACELTLFNSNEFNKCNFQRFRTGCKVKNTQHLNFTSCNFEHCKYDSISIHRDRSVADEINEQCKNINIRDCYFETVWNPLLEPVTWNYTTEWVDGCTYIRISDNSVFDTNISGCYFANVGRYKESAKTLSFEPIVNKGRMTKITGVSGDSTHSLFKNNKIAKVINANSEFMFKDKNTKVPLGVILGNNSSIDTTTSDFTVTLNSSNSSFKYYFCSPIDVKTSTVLISLEADGDVEVVYRNETIGSNRKRELLNCDGREILYTISDGNDVYSDRIYSFEFINKNNAQNKIKVNYIKVINTLFTSVDDVSSLPYYVSPLVITNDIVVDKELSLTRGSHEDIDSKIYDFLGNELSYQESAKNFTNFKKIDSEKFFDTKELDMTFDENKNLVLNIPSSDAGKYRNQVILEVNGNKNYDSVTFYFETESLSSDEVYPRFAAVVDTEDGASAGGSFVHEIKNTSRTPKQVTIPIGDKATAIRFTFGLTKKNNVGSGKIMFYNVRYKFNNCKEQFYFKQKPIAYQPEGTIIYNSYPSSGNYIGWVSVYESNRQTWKGFGLIE